METNGGHRVAVERGLLLFLTVISVLIEGMTTCGPTNFRQSKRDLKTACVFMATYDFSSGFWRPHVDRFS